MKLKPQTEPSQTAPEEHAEKSAVHSAVSDAVSQQNYQCGDEVLYVRTQELAQVLKVHTEDPDGVYLTICMPDGREKQTTLQHVQLQVPDAQKVPEKKSKRKSVDGSGHGEPVDLPATGHLKTKNRVVDDTSAGGRQAKRQKEDEDSENKRRQLERALKIVHEAEGRGDTCKRVKKDKKMKKEKKQKNNLNLTVMPTNS